MALPAAGQVLRKAEYREEIVEGMARVLEREAVGEEDWSDLKSPFVVELPEEEATEVEVETKPEAEPEPRVAQISDRRALLLINERFRPQGSLVLGDRGILQLAEGRRIAQGQVFRATVRGKTYEVEVGTVTAEGYELRLGSHRVSGNFSSTGGASRGGNSEAEEPAAEPEGPNN